MSINQSRRNLLKNIAGISLVALFSNSAFATEWNQNAFDSKNINDAIKKLGIDSLTESKDIILKAPDLAENSAVVPIEVISKLPNTQEIIILAEKNPFPLVGSFEITEFIDPYISIRTKLAQTSIVKVIIKANNKFYFASKEVKVTIGGCGG